MRTINYDFLKQAKNMPPLIHKTKGQDFNTKKSEVCDWLCQIPEVRQKIFDWAKEKRLIQYDSQTGKWKGRNYED